MKEFNDYPFEPRDERAWRFLWGALFGVIVGAFAISPLSPLRVYLPESELLLKGICGLFMLVGGLAVISIPRRSFSKISIDESIRIERHGKSVCFDCRDVELMIASLGFVFPQGISFRKILIHAQGRWHTLWLLPEEAQDCFQAMREGCLEAASVDIDGVVLVPVDLSPSKRHRLVSLIRRKWLGDISRVLIIGSVLTVFMLFVINYAVNKAAPGGELARPLVYAVSGGFVGLLFLGYGLRRTWKYLCVWREMGGDDRKDQ